MKKQQISAGKVIGWALLAWFLACPAIYYLIWHLPTKPYASLPVAWIGGVALSTIGPVLALAALLSFNLARAFLYAIFSPWGFVAIALLVRAFLQRSAQKTESVSEDLKLDQIAGITESQSNTAPNGSRVLGLGKTVALSLSAWMIFFLVIYGALERMLFGFGGLFVITSPLGLVTSILSGNIPAMTMELMMFAISPYAFILYGLSIRRLMLGGGSAVEGLSAADRYAMAEKAASKE